jgi:deazaflavin-dependent oxidoreductase (nitroreductase family)
MFISGGWIPGRFRDEGALPYPGAMSNAKDLLTRSVTTLHRVIYSASGGRLLNKGAGMPVVILTTTGRKSGQKRPTMLTAPIHDPDLVVLVASNGGDDRHPIWFLNLRDDPAVELEMEGDKRAMTARTASADEKAELWPRVVAANKGYAGYQEKTERDIPLVILEP